jgi:pilus assembly protein Flp/PilA
MRHLIACLQNSSGATAIEYGLIAGLISITIIGTATILGGNIIDLYNHIAERMMSALA